MKSKIALFLALFAIALILTVATQPVQALLGPCQELCGTACAPGWTFNDTCSCQISMVCCPRSNLLYVAVCRNESGNVCRANSCGVCTGKHC